MKKLKNFLSYLWFVMSLDYFQLFSTVVDVIILVFAIVNYEDIVSQPTLFLIFIGFLINFIWQCFNVASHFRFLMFELKQSYELYQIYQGMVEECDKEIEKLLQGFVSRIDKDKVELLRTKKRINKKNAVAFDVESYANAIWGVNAMAITGMSSGSLLQLIGELGSDFTDKFDCVPWGCGE